MAPEEQLENDAPEASHDRLAGGAYEIIRKRLQQHGSELRSRLELLNELRKDVFGSIETTLLKTERITTDNNCVPRDLLAIDDFFLFAYNVRFGLKSEVAVSDVFAAYEFRDGSFYSFQADFLNNSEFVRDFRDIYRFYKNASFNKFFVSDTAIHMVFQVGKVATDIKSLKWVRQDGELHYVGNRSDHEVRFPPQYEFEWTRTHRDLHYHGPHPHISIDDRLFVETVGGDLTIKIENNTETGEGIYSEDVDDSDQTLDDAEIFYATVGNIILLKIRPYREDQFRYIVYNEKIQKAQRLDAIEHACVLLPDDHGLIFSNGYYLQSGESKTFPNDLKDMLYERCIAAPNGEDYQYVFHNREEGVNVLLRYNLISQQVDTPLVCHGATFFDDGRMICFRGQDEPQKHHPLQIWQTPYVGDEFVPHANTDSYLFKIGNREVVRGMSECHEVLNLLNKDESFANLYVDTVRLTGDILDSYFWISSDEAAALGEPLAEIRDTAVAAVDEFEKVVRVRRDTQQKTKVVEKAIAEELKLAQRRRFEHVNDFVQSLASLRQLRGNAISLKELRYADIPLIESLENSVSEATERLALRCVEFLLRDKALAPYEKQVGDQHAQVADLETVAEGRILEEQVSGSANELEMLIDIVSNLKIDDATQRTTIIDNISTIFSSINQTRAALKNRIKDLMSVEGIAEFNSQIKLLNQSVVNYLDICDTPEKCDEFLTKVMIQLEELEGRFAEFDEFVEQLTEKREEVYNAFESRKLGLVETRNRRAASLMNAAERILKGIKTRIDNIESVNEIHSYFASDLMIDKVRDIVDELTELGDTVKVDDIQSKLKATREDAVRQLKDEQELFVDGKNIIRFGEHHFTVNHQPLDLTTVMQDEDMCLHLTGTNFFEPIEQEEFVALRDVWKQEVISESKDVYRSEYLAYQLFHHLGQDGLPTAQQWLKQDEAARLKVVQIFSGPRYAEAYTKGVHDADAAKILAGLARMSSALGLLRYGPQARAMAAVFWQEFVDPDRRDVLTAQLQSLGAIQAAFSSDVQRGRSQSELAQLLGGFQARYKLYSDEFVEEAAEYLVELLIFGGPFVVSQDAYDLAGEFRRRLRAANQEDTFRESLARVEQDVERRMLVANQWADAFVTAHLAEKQGGSQQDASEKGAGKKGAGKKGAGKKGAGKKGAGKKGAEQPAKANADRPDAATASDEGTRDFAWEIGWLLLRDEVDSRHVIPGKHTEKLSGLAGDHSRLQRGEYRLNFNQFTHRLAAYDHNVVPRFRRFHECKHELLEHTRNEMRLTEFLPRVLTSFVRNRLIDQVYLPLVGDNLAKQIGVAGEQKRTDRMGMLLLISPPGYGKTTLMEYISNRLGLIFMKINGPAIGHQVTSLDPEEAPNAAAREELVKLNLSLEMGDNVMLYVDDIQHCNTEFLQKFISLCDAQRKIEGVYKGQTRTYDLRGRKVAVIMAGNPYTESGEKFQIPDMLSNRADIYNLGEIIGDSADAFELSYIENCLTSNPALNPLASRSQKDVYSVVKIAQTGSQEGIDLEGQYSPEELSEMVSVIEKLLRVRDVVLKVNREYIRSAAQADEFRTEPPFKLQGSYRNMNRIAERVVPIMNDAELETLIASSYEGDAQTLTSEAESNLLKFRELLGILTDEESQRWDDIKRTFCQNVKMKGIGSDDQAAHVIAQLSGFNDQLEALRRTLVEAAQQSREAGRAADDERAGELTREIGQLNESILQVGESLANVATAPGAAAPGAAAPGTGRPSAVALAKDPSTQVHRLTVQHKVPRSILEVLRNQFDLMQEWMEPTLAQSQLQTGELKKLRLAVDACVASYAKLVGELEAAQPDAPPKSK